MRILDGTQAFNEMEENAKKKYRKKVTARLAHLGDIPPEAYKIPEDDLIPIEENVKLELGFHLLDNIQTPTFLIFNRLGQGSLGLYAKFNP